MTSAEQNPMTPPLATVSDIRYENFLRLFAEWEQSHPEFAGHGSVKKFASAVGISERQIGHLRSQHRGIGNATARKLEAALLLPVGWMDNRHSDQTHPTPAVNQPDGATETSDHDFSQPSDSRSIDDVAEEQALLLLRAALRLDRDAAMREITKLYARMLEADKNTKKNEVRDADGKVRLKGDGAGG